MPGQPPINDDLRELIGLFQSHGVEYLIVGAHALAFHSRPRFTEYLDIFLRRSRDNAARVRIALEQFGIDVNDEAEAKLAEDERAMIVLGRKPNQVDLLNFLDGVTFEEAWQRKVLGTLGDIPVPFLSLEDLVTTKRKTGRSRDLQDLDQLREVRGKLPGDD